MKRIFLPVDIELQDDVPVRVDWDGTTYRVKSLVECWIVETQWWTEAGETRRVYYRLYTDRGVLEVFEARTNWVLARIAD
jgi:hypothetical protein